MEEHEIEKWTYSWVDVAPLGVGIGEQSATSGSVGVHIEVIKLENVIICLQSLGELLSREVQSWCGENGVGDDHCYLVVLLLVVVSIREIGN